MLSDLEIGSNPRTGEIVSSYQSITESKCVTVELRYQVTPLTRNNQRYGSEAEDLIRVSSPLKARSKAILLRYLGVGP